MTLQEQDNNKNGFTKKPWLQIRALKMSVSLSQNHCQIAKSLAPNAVHSHKSLILSNMKLLAYFSLKTYIYTGEVGNHAN